MGIWYFYFETYVQDHCTDVEFLDSHITVYCMKRKHVKRLLKKLGFPALRVFLKEYTYDWSEQLYLAAKAVGAIDDEFIERSSI